MSDPSGVAALVQTPHARLFGSDLRLAVQLDQTTEAAISVAYSITLPVLKTQANASGISAPGLVFLARGPYGASSFVFRTSANVPLDLLLGTIRWGYCDPDAGNPASFIELGWDTFRSPGRAEFSIEVPAGKRLEVWARWKRVGVGWTCVVS